VSQPTDGDRDALIIATGTYADRELRRLRAPAQDARALADVLGNPVIGDFRVQQVIDQPAHLLRRAVERFFSDRSRHDLLLVHLSCHGIKDDDGRLYFAASDTDKQLLHSTALSAAELSDLMDRCRARSIVLLIDCCYSGAFLPGSKSDRGVHLRESLEGRGRAIITATNAIEYAWEGDELSGQGQPSVFTAAIVEGLRTGEADRDRDGAVSIHDLYDYVEDRVRAAKHGQTPLMWSLAVQHDLYIARTPTAPQEGPGEGPEALIHRSSAPRRRAVAVTAAAAVAIAVTGGVLLWQERDCSVHSDGNLHCNNTPYANVYLHATYDSPVSGIMKTTHSWFICWQHGQPDHAGKDIWYETQGDQGQNGYNAWGFMPASDLQTTVNPAPGLRQCRHK
jgi:Caspase domain